MVRKAQALAVMEQVDAHLIAKGDVCCAWSLATEQLGLSGPHNEIAHPEHTEGTKRTGFGVAPWL